jgi:hypothetical protein
MKKSIDGEELWKTLSRIGNKILNVLQILFGFFIALFIFCIVIHNGILLIYFHLYEVILGSIIAIILTSITSYFVRNFYYKVWFFLLLTAIFVAIIIVIDPFPSLHYYIAPLGELVKKNY